MKNGKLDAIIADKIVALSYVSKDNKSFKLSGISFSPDPIGICFRKDEADLHKKIDDVITQMKKDGSLGKISRKWFGEDLSTGF